MSTPQPVLFNECLYSVCLNLLDLVMFYFFPDIFFSCDLCPFCDFRYDIDSKSPDLAKHVSEVDQEFDFTFDP